MVPIGVHVSFGSNMTCAPHLPLLLGHCRGEIRILTRDPIDEFAHAGVGQQTLHIHPMALKFGSW